MPKQYSDPAKLSPQGAERIRPLAVGDLDALVAMDKAVSGRPRRGFFERRLAHLDREPSAFVALAAERQGRLVGFVFARLYEGEFGGKVPQAALDTIGVATEARHKGVGRQLIESMAAAMQAHGIKEIATQADWTDTDLTAFFAAMRFSLAPRLVLDQRRLMESGGAPSPARTKPWPAHAASAETDYSGPSGDDFQALSHDRLPVRSMAKKDLGDILRIDKLITGRDRTAYFERKFAEAMEESGVRVSLVAEIGGQVSGFIMARVDFGEFGSLEPEAVIDTIGVDARNGHKGVGSALISQLMTNLVGLRVERVRTEVDWNQFGLLSFLDRMGFRPHRRLALHRGVGV